MMDFAGIAELLETAGSLKLIDKRGSWYSFQGKTLAQGTWNAWFYLASRPDILARIRTVVAAFSDKTDKFGAGSSRNVTYEDTFAEKITSSDRTKISQILSEPLTHVTLDFFSPQMICSQFRNPAARLKLVRSLRDRAAAGGLLKHAPWLDRMLADPLKTMVEPEPFLDEDEYLRLMEHDDP
jgi:hypothetical protein